ncbi:MAG: hypothetical protein U0R44_06300 [Candidatus Micrarchaeia archaeon]
MASLRKRGETKAQELGVSSFDTRLLSLRSIARILDAEGGPDRPAAKPPNPGTENRTVELSMVEIIEQPPARRRRPKKKNAVDEVDELIRDLEERHSTRPPPSLAEPVAAPQIPLTGARGENSVLFRISSEPANPESSIVTSLADLQRLGRELRAEPPEVKAAASESSVVTSLAELQKIEAERVQAPPAKPALKKAQPESSVVESLEEIRRIHEERVAAEEMERMARLQMEMEAAALKEKEEAEQARIQEEAAALIREEMLAREVDDLLDSLPPPGEHDARSTIYKLNEKETIIFKDDFPEGQGRWIIPVDHAGDADSEEAVDRILASPTIVLAGKSYYICEERHGIEKAVRAVRKGDALSLSNESPEASVEIQIEVDFGIPWGDEHVEHRLSEDERVMCDDLMPERKVLWLVPVPPSGTKDKGDLEVITRFKEEPIVRIAGKAYYVYEGESGYGNARKIARVGDTLQVWPVATTDYEILGEPSMEIKKPLSQPARKRSEWPDSFYTHQMSEEEMADHRDHLPEGAPVLIYPVPEPGSEISLDRTVVRDLAEKHSAQRVLLGGREYFAFRMREISAWREIAIMCPQTRVASRHGRTINIWEENGSRLFSNTAAGGTSGHTGPPLPPTEGYVFPSPAELLDLEGLYNLGKKSRYLYALPDDLGKMNIDSFNSLVMIGVNEAKETSMSPLISIRGRWYMALEYPMEGARRTELRRERIYVHPSRPSWDGKLGELRARLVAKRKAGEPEVVRLPQEPRARLAAIRMFKEGEARFVIHVEPGMEKAVPESQRFQTVDGETVSTWRVVEEDIPGHAIAVMRRGEDIFPIEQRAESVRAPPRRSTMAYGTKIRAPEEASEAAIEVTSGQIIVEPAGNGPPRSEDKEVTEVTTGQIILEPIGKGPLPSNEGGRTIEEALIQVTTGDLLVEPQGPGAGGKKGKPS